MRTRRQFISTVETAKMLRMRRSNLINGKYKGRRLERHTITGGYGYDIDEVVRLKEYREDLSERHKQVNARYRARLAEEKEQATKQCRERARIRTAYSVERSGYRYHVYCGNFWVANCDSEAAATEYLIMQRGKAMLSRIKH